MAVQIQFRRGTAAAWTAANTVLAEGELGLETDTDLFKIGDGTTAWTSLGYAALNSTTISPTIFDAKGDIIAASAADTAARVAVGSNNTVLMADSAQTAGVKWASEATATLTAKGDLLTATAANTLARQAVGTNNQILMADSAQTNGIKWAASATSTLTTTGDVLYASGANTLARLGIGTTGQALVVSGGLPSWGNVASSGESDQITLAVQVFS